MRKIMLVVLVLLTVASALTAQEGDYTVIDIPHASMGYTAALSPDGETLAVWHHDQIYAREPLAGYPIVLFNITNGLRRSALPGATDFTTSALFSADGTQLISAHLNGDVIIWDVAGHSITRTIETLVFNIRLIDFMPDGHTVALFLPSDPSRIALLDLETGAMTHMLGTHFETMSAFTNNMIELEFRGEFTLISADISADGRLAVSNANGDVLLWDIDTNEPALIHASDDEEGPLRFNVRNLAWTPDGDLLYSYRPAEAIMRLAGPDFDAEVINTGVVEAFALHPDGETLAYVTQEGLYLTTLEAPQDVVQITLPGVDGELNARFPLAQLLFTADGSRLILAGLHDTGNDGNHIYVVALD